MIIDNILIDHLEMVAKELTDEAEYRRRIGHFGNSLGMSECKRKLEFCAEVLMSIRSNISY